MIPLALPATAEGDTPFVTRLRCQPANDRAFESRLISARAGVTAFSGSHGLIAIEGVDAAALDGDVVLVHPAGGRIERLLRADSQHNSLLVTERCDQLCLMCSQPPKKTHDDRFVLLEQACLLAPEKAVIGITGGEPTLFKDALLSMIERVLATRPDVEFHVLTNAQHFEEADIERLRAPIYRRVAWGIPLYAAAAPLHDEIVGKAGAFDRLERSLRVLLLAGASVELRTVVLQLNLNELPALARRVSNRLQFIHSWSIMQLENMGFARNRWSSLYVDHRQDFRPLAAALDRAALHGIHTRLFNFALCTVPERYRSYAAASISDWKRKLAPGCEACREKDHCSGFFEWHPDQAMREVVTPL